MKKKSYLLKKAEELVFGFAKEHVPESSETQAVIDQWFQAIATDSDLFCNHKVKDQEKLKIDITFILSVNGFFNDRKEFYDLVFDRVELKPSFDHEFKFIDLFAGIGGTRIGAQRNNGACVFSSEFDRFAQDTYNENYGELPFGDITKVQEECIPDHDLLLAGFPCQPFSYSGRSEGFEDKTRGTLFFDVLRVLDEKKPKVVLLENVKGFKSHDSGNTMFIALKALEEAGYTAYWKILNSYDYGVPQYRERWYCVAIRNDLDTSSFSFPKNEDRTTTLKDIVDENLEDKSLEINDFEKSRIRYHFENNHISERVKHDNSMYAPNTKKGRHGVYSYTKKDGSLRFHVGDIAKTQIQEAFYACLDTYAPTIIANRTPKLWDIERKLSVPESSRLQGFPSDFSFNVSNAQSYKQLGNAVTVSVVEALVSQILKIEGFK